MAEATATKPWAFIAHKDGCYAGIASAELPKRDLRKFLGDYAADGFSILSVNNREEYDAEMAKLKSWKHHANG